MHYLTAQVCTYTCNIHIITIPSDKSTLKLSKQLNLPIESSKSFTIGSIGSLSILGRVLAVVVLAAVVFVVS